MNVLHRPVALGLAGIFVCSLAAPLAAETPNRDTPQASAAGTPDPDSTRAAATTLDIDPVIVTSTRSAQTIDEALASVTVIDRAEIERLQPQQFTDLLESRAGIQTSSNGAFGKATSVFTRGTNSDHTLLLVNGVRMGSATTGGSSWQFLPPNAIDRVEIVRGPRTSIHGSDAIGGVVQVFTRTGQPGPPRIDAFAGFGSLGTREIGAGISGGSERTTYGVSLGHFRSDGIDVKDDGEDDRDGYDNTSLTGRVTHRFGERSEVFGSLFVAQGTTEFDGTVNETDYRNAAGRIGLRFAPTARWDSEISYAHSRDESDNFGPNDFFSRFDTLRDTIDWKNDVRINEQVTASVGVDARRDRVRSTTEYDEDSRDNVGVWTLLRGDFGRHSFEGSLRYDDNEQFGGETTGQLAWGMQASESLRIRAGYGTAFKAPSFNDLYFPGFGNPDVQPESSRTFEFGLRHTMRHGFVDATLFETHVDSLIAFQSVNGQFQPVNVDEARIRGLELEAGHDIGAWTLRTALTLLDAENRSTGNELRRRAPATARIDIDRHFDRLAVGSTLTARSRAFENAANTDRLSGYALLDLRASYVLTPKWLLEGSIKNVFDRDYETARGFNQAGRTAFIKLRYQP